MSLLLVELALEMKCNPNAALDGQMAIVQSKLTNKGDPVRAFCNYTIDVHWLDEDHDISPLRTPTGFDFHSDDDDKSTILYEHNQPDFDVINVTKYKFHPTPLVIAAMVGKTRILRLLLDIEKQTSVTSSTDKFTCEMAG